MDQKAYRASGFEHGTVAGLLWQKRALGLAAGPQANSGPERVGKESYFHHRICRTLEKRAMSPRVDPKFFNHV